MHSLVRFANIAAGGQVHHRRSLRSGTRRPGQNRGGISTGIVSLCDLAKLRAKGLVERIPRSRRYRLVGRATRFCVACLRLFEKIYAPITAGLLQPFRGDRVLAEENAAKSTACISASAMTWMRYCKRSASRSLREPLAAHITATKRQKGRSDAALFPFSTAGRK